MNIYLHIFYIKGTIIDNFPIIALNYWLIVFFAAFRDELQVDEKFLWGNGVVGSSIMPQAKYSRNRMYPLTFPGF